MPWTCAHCQQEVNDGVPCATCGASKTSWTIVVDRTRTLTIARKRFTLLTGSDVTPRPPGDPTLASVTLVPATELVSLTRDDALALAALGQLPATADTLFVALEGPGATKGDVTVEVLFANRPSEERVIAGPAPADGHVKLLFVHGEGGIADLSFEGMHVVEVTDPPDAHAPTVEVSALGREAASVALTALSDLPFSA